MQKPYIGITGFTRNDQITEILKIMPHENTHLLMVGVLINSATMKGISGNARYANKYCIEGIFLNDERVLNMLHFNTFNEEYLLRDLIKLVEIGGKNLHGFQLNFRWPKSLIIKNFKKQYPDKKFVIQMEKEDFKEFSPTQMANKLQEYEYLADYVILDMSMGAGIQMNTNLLISYANAIKNISNLNIVFAGGLCTQNISIIKPIIELFPEASIDAEGQLLNQNGVLSIKRSSDYLQAALKMFQK